MELWVSTDDREIVEQAKKEVVLGIITRSGQVRLQVADADRFPEHVEWLARETVDAVRGFSLLVVDGEVTAFFPRSRLNPGGDPRLETEYIQGVLHLLPTIPNVKWLE